MVLTRFQKSVCVNDVLIFVDVSGSTSGYTTKQYLEDKVEALCNTTNGNVSLYTSNHDLQQRYFLNPGKMIPRQKFTFGGLSAVYDNVIEAIEHRFKYDHETPCDVYIISDMEDNVSMYNNIDDIKAQFALMSRFWNISVIHPNDIDARTRF